MNGPLLAIGALLALAGAMVLAFAHLNPEPVRREKRRTRSLSQKAREAGLRGRYAFVADRSKWDTIGGFGTYEPVDVEDRALYAAIGSKIESESAFFAKVALWTDARLAWVGFPAILIGGICALVSWFG